jgi:hypothetical protein
MTERHRAPQLIAPFLSLQRDKLDLCFLSLSTLSFSHSADLLLKRVYRLLTPLEENIQSHQAIWIKVSAHS